MNADARPERSVLTVSCLLSISTDKWEDRWRQQHRHIRLSIRRDSDDPGERSAVIDALASGELDVALIRLYGNETLADVGTTSLHAITLYEESQVVLISSDHPLATEEFLEAALLSDFGLDSAVLPAPMARDALQKTLAIVPVTGLEPSRIVCVWLTARDADDVQDFVGLLRGRTGRSSRAQA